MVLAGLVLTVIGFLISLVSLGFTESVGARMGMVLVGIVLSFTGIIGLINSAYLRNAIWKK